MWIGASLRDFPPTSFHGGAVVHTNGTPVQNEEDVEYDTIDVVLQLVYRYDRAHSALNDKFEEQKTNSCER
jgi:hypothetical protein